MMRMSKLMKNLHQIDLMKKNVELRTMTTKVSSQNKIN